MGKRFLWLMFVIVAFVSAATAQKKKPSAIKFSSVYTDVERDCKDALNAADAKEAEANGQDIPLVCKGYGGYRINIGFSAAAAFVSLENPKTDETINLGNDNLSYGNTGKIEWRLANGKPFAVIVRFGKYREMGADEDNPLDEKLRIGSRLIIKGLKGYEKIDFEIDGAAAAANSKARQKADENYSKRTGEK